MPDASLTSADAGPQVELSTALWMREGASDKVYEVRLERSGDGWVVNAAWGRRGATMATGCKTGSAPVDRAKAEDIYGKLVREKVAKGYRVDGAVAGQGHVMAGEVRERTGVVPQLLNPVEEGGERALLDDPRWGAQEKHDGMRLVLIRESDGGEVVAGNRRGERTGLAREIADSLPRGSFVLDGEGLGTRFAAFDLLEAGGEDLRALPYRTRHARLLALSERFGPSVFVSPLALSAAEKADLAERMRREGREGVVFKRLDAPHAPGRPASGGAQVKWKFVAAASCVVAAANSKRSVRLSMFDAAGTEVGVGNVTIPANHAVPIPGEVVEVRYLYAHPGGSLFQPVYLGPRPDLDRGDCLLSSLKFKRAHAPDREAEDSESAPAAPGFGR